jgi:magnesium chelatase subunit D
MANTSRQRVVRADGRTISVLQRRAHLSYCFTGCCCGKTLVKGAVAGLMDTSVRRHDEVAVVVFRGAAAEIVLHPTCDAQEARAALTYLPTGGRTPLAHGLELAAGLVTEDTAMVLLTDGRANVPSRTEDPWADALDAAAAITCPVLVIDSETGPHPSGRARQLADRMHGTHLALDALDEVRLLDLVRPMAERATAQP